MVNVANSQHIKFLDYNSSVDGKHVVVNIVPGVTIPKFISKVKVPILIGIAFFVVSAVFAHWDIRIIKDYSIEN